MIPQQVHTAAHREAPWERATSRRSLLRALALGGVALAAAGVGANAALAQSDDGTTEAASITNIINLAATLEMLSVTVYGNAIANAATLGISGAGLAFLRAAQAEEEDHARILRLAGGQAVTDTFSLPGGAAVFASLPAFLGLLQALENDSTAAYLTVVPVFAAAGRPDLAQLAARIAAVEGEHRVLARILAGQSPANNRSFEDPRYASVAEINAQIQALGLLSPSGANSFQYPGPVAIDATGITNRHP